jgi:hypothetical protein
MPATGIIDRSGWQPSQAAWAAGTSISPQYDAPLPWVAGGSSCGGGVRPGTRFLGNFVRQVFPGITELGLYNCRANTANTSNTSVHGTGRAVDFMIPTVGGRPNLSIGTPIANWLVQNANAIGIQYVIWAENRWSRSAPSLGFERYVGPNRHIDHVHTELTIDGGEQRTPWFQNPTGPQEEVPGWSMVPVFGAMLLGMGAVVGYWWWATRAQ